MVFLIKILVFLINICVFFVKVLVFPINKSVFLSKILVSLIQFLAFLITILVLRIKLVGFLIQILVFLMKNVGCPYQNYVLIHYQIIHFIGSTPPPLRCYGSNATMVADLVFPMLCKILSVSRCAPQFQGEPHEDIGEHREP